MDYIDARRLTGPNLLANKPGAILDVRCSEEEVKKLIPFWQGRIKKMLKALGWQSETTNKTYLTNGASLFFSAPIDALYAATEIQEWAWARCDAEFNDKKAPNFEETKKRIKKTIEAEANRKLIELQKATTKKKKSFLWDDDQASIGMGSGSRTWPVNNLPNPIDIDWKIIHDIPTALVTGTNGKTTTVRIAAHIARTANRNVGLSSTDWIAVNDNIIDRDDWAGPGGARQVLRQQDVELAILETARGGLLRRGLSLERADVALITNIAEDHLGDFGSQTTEEILNIKWIVSRAVEANGILILNADDELLRKKARNYKGKIVWFSLDPNNRTIKNHASKGGTAFVIDENNELIKIDKRIDQRSHKGTARTICNTNEIPITLNGTARHNIANALAAAALCYCLKIPMKHIQQGLKSMSQDDNPGRSNIYEIKDFKVLVDFAHNPHAMQALFNMARALPAKRRLLAFGQAGDRTDAQIRQLAKSAWQIGLDQVIVSELEAYARGRKKGEVFAIIKDELIKTGARENQIQYFEKELDSLDTALNWAQPNDLIIMLALSERTDIQEKLKFLLP